MGGGRWKKGKTRADECGRERERMIEKGRTIVNVFANFRFKFFCFVVCVYECVCTSVCVWGGVGIDLLTQKNGVETQRNNCTDTHARPVAIHRIEKRFFCKQKRIMINRKHDLSTNDGREQEEEGLNRKQKNKIFQEKWRERASGLQKNRYQRAEERCDFLASLLFFCFFLFSRAGRVGVGGGANLFSVAHLIKSSRRIAMQRGRRG